jgi:predicted metal-binding protein
MLRRAMADEPESDEEFIALEVCHRCLVRLPTQVGGADLPRRLREALAARGLSERARVLPSACMGYCPQGLVSVLVVPHSSGRGTHPKLIDPERDGEDLAEHVAGVKVPGDDDGPATPSP